MNSREGGIHFTKCLRDLRNVGSVFDPRGFPDRDGSADVQEPGSLDNRWHGDVERKRGAVGDGVSRDPVAEEDGGVPLAPEGGPPAQASVPASVEGGGDLLGESTVSIRRSRSAVIWSSVSAAGSQRSSILGHRSDARRHRHKRVAMPPDGEVVVRERFGGVAVAWIISATACSSLPAR
jgi:hypothetical protein